MCQACRQGRFKSLVPSVSEASRIRDTLSGPCADFLCLNMASREKGEMLCCCQQEGYQVRDGLDVRRHTST